ncbi:MAG: phosphate ABC transporter ATP-binding protein PstB [Cyanobacteria bacterium J06639_1]
MKESEIILATKDVSVYYGDSLAVSDINLDIPKNQITALIGPSGCGKSTLIRCFNRLNDLIPSARVKGKVTFYNCDLYDSHVDAAIVRRYIGMVFQKPNPFPDSIYDNIAYGAMICGFQGNMDELVERSLRRAALWDEVKDILSHSGLSLSGGQQQRLCIARAIAVDPEVVLMDEPCSSLDPITTSKIEDLMRELKEHYTIVIVTHNMQQAARISDMTAFFNTDVNEKGSRYGYLVEYDTTHTVFDCPNHEATQAYISGQFG